MKVLVTGSSGHLGEALVRTLSELGHEVVGLDILERPFTTFVGSITDRDLAVTQTGIIPTQCDGTPSPPIRRPFLA
jgi:nucleoside-diphosphate-sugar epimerase